MVDRTDRHFRWVLRRLAPSTTLYTEMITAPAVLRGDKNHLLDFDPTEHPLALQLAADDPQMVGKAAAIGVEWGYDEINLNCGCPSDKVQEAHFGACLMAEPELSARLVKAMVESAPSVPVTVKHRIGIRGRETYEDMREFAASVWNAGASRLIIHARIAILEGLSPKENRTVPPLRYEDVVRLKEEFPSWNIEINGGITQLSEILRFAQTFDGVMLGRAAYDDPYLVADAERALYGSGIPPSRASLLKQMSEYWKPWEDAGNRWHLLLRHFSGLFSGLPGSRRWKQLISPPFKCRTAEEVVERALREIPGESLSSNSSAGLEMVH